MLKKFTLYIFSGMLMLNLYGCVALLAGVAGGAGTAVWLSGKLTQEFHAPYHRTIEATHSALQSLNVPILKETEDHNVTQIKGTYTDGKEMWIDITTISEESTKVEVRIGGVNPDKDADAMLIKKIQSFL